MENKNDKLLTYSGTVEDIIYTNEENGYSVFVLETDGDEIITAVGTIPYITEGEMLIVYGTWVHHNVYGRQFSVDSYEKQMPADEASILRYLASGAIKGVGPKTAQRIVGMYGTESFDIIENRPDWLAEIPGISRKKAEEISKNFKEQAGMRSVMMFCREFFGPNTSVKIYKKWGSSAVDIIRANPYRLCSEIGGVGFERADTVASAIGFARDSDERVKSGIKYVLTGNAHQNGHTCLPREKLIDVTCAMLSVGKEHVGLMIEELIQSKELYAVLSNGAELVFSSRAYRAEKYSADKLNVIKTSCRSIGASDIALLIEKIELDEGIKYAALQRKSIETALTEGVFILTGGPGTGKTTIVRALLRIFTDMGYRVALTAPTGRAAKRLSESTSEEAKTIHRLLEMNYGDEDEPKFMRTEHNLLEEDVIIVDEASMIDSILFESLLKAIKRGARLILIGDVDQLPSVGAGNVLSDLISSEKFKTVRLTEIFRQAEESLIVYNAHRINNGEYPELDVKDKDFFFLPRNGDKLIAATVVDLCINRLPKTYGDDVFKKIQVISPSRKGEAGTESLNELIQAAVNPPLASKPEKKLYNRTFRVGDRVMQTRNDYDIEWERDGTRGSGIFNGDIGVIEDMDYIEEAMLINFDGRYVTYDFSQCDELDHAYAMTVHKSQGSEYPIVIIPTGSFAPQLKTRNLLYTAVTRAKKMVIIVGDKNSVYEMVDNDRQVKRYTGLEMMLTETET